MKKPELLKRLNEAHELLANELAKTDDAVQIAKAVAAHTFRSLQALRDVTASFKGCYGYCSEASSQLTGVTHLLAGQERKELVS